MISLVKGQAVPNRPDLVVQSPTRDYEVTEYVNCALIGSPDFPICAFLADYFIDGYGTD